MAENIIDKAIIFATEAHKGTMRKGSDIPYIMHPLETGIITASMTMDAHVIAAAILHDVLEDTKITYEELQEQFGTVAEFVQAETENKRKYLSPEETWKIRKQETIVHLNMEKKVEVKIIALADKLSNIRSMYRDYQVLGDGLWEKFHEKRKSEQGWYYKELLEALKDLENTLAYQEYQVLVEKVFGK